ncbi:hypothetical protein ACFQV4_27475 [Streptomyces thermocarboxydus]
MIEGGTRSNVTAGRATAHLDVRVASAAEQDRITRALAELRPVDPGRGWRSRATGTVRSSSAANRSRRLRSWRSPWRVAWGTTSRRRRSAGRVTATSSRRRVCRCWTASGRSATGRTRGRVRVGVEHGVPGGADGWGAGEACRRVRSVRCGASLRVSRARLAFSPGQLPRTVPAHGEPPTQQGVAHGLFVLPQRFTWPNAPRLRDHARAHLAVRPLP